jgi:PPOX class probable F420-dependent enzyme
MPIPPEIHAQKYISLTTFRMSGVAVPTPVWFAERNQRLYVMTRSDSGKYKRIRNNGAVKVAPCTARGKVTGPEFPARARILPMEEWGAAKAIFRKKYWLARLPFWSKKNEYLEIEIAA